MLSRFREFPRLRGLVFGAVGEVSKDVDDLVRIMAHAGATVHGLARGSTSVAAATGQLAWLIKRRLARIDSYYRAKLLLDRRMFIGPNARQAGEGRFDAPVGPRPGRSSEAERTSKRLALITFCYLDLTPNFNCSNCNSTQRCAAHGYLR